MKLGLSFVLLLVLTQQLKTDDNLNGDMGGKGVSRLLGDSDGLTDFIRLLPLYITIAILIVIGCLALLRFIISSIYMWITTTDWKFVFQCFECCRDK